MTTFCPHCSNHLLPPKPTEVRAEIRTDGTGGLCVELAFEHDRCGGYVIIEDANLDDGVVGKGTSGFMRAFEGKGYRV